MMGLRLLRTIPRGYAFNPGAGVALAGSLILFFGFSEFALAACPEKPTVWMDEQTAATHLRAQRFLELPESMAWNRSVQEVALVVTVDRGGNICGAEPTSGPPALRKKAVQAIRKHWRYRPFLVDWKPVVAQFPVTVRFFPPKKNDTRRRLARVRGTAGGAAFRS